MAKAPVRDDSALATPALPAKIELIPGQLNVRVYKRHDPYKPSAVSQWSYVTSGLWKLGQKELMLTLDWGPGEIAGDFPRDPLKFFTTVHTMASQGKLVDVGDYSQFGSAFLGDPGIAGVMYIPPEESGPSFADADSKDAADGTTEPPPYLAVITLTAEELAALKEYGPTRVFASLGKASRYYPYPYWVKRGRTTTITSESNERTILSKINRWRSPGIRVRQDGDVLVLWMALAARPQLRELAQELSPERPLALLTELDPIANACLTWHAGATRIEAISPDGSDASRMTGAFVGLLAEQPTDQFRTAEDGFLLMLTDASFGAIRQALLSSTPLTLPMKDGKQRLALEWQSEDTKKSDFAWERPIGVTLLNPDGEFRRRTRSDVKSLIDYINTLQNETADYWKQTPHPGAKGLFVAVGVKPSQKVRVWCEHVEGSLPAAALRELEGKLSALPPTVVREGPVAFTISFTFPGQKVDGFPMLPTAWSEEVPSGSGSLAIPDDMFRLIWPDGETTTDTASTPSTTATEKAPFQWGYIVIPTMVILIVLYIMWLRTQAPPAGSRVQVQGTVISAPATAPGRVQ